MVLVHTRETKAYEKLVSLESSSSLPSTRTLIFIFFNFLLLGKGEISGGLPFGSDLFSFFKVGRTF